MTTRSTLRAYVALAVAVAGIAWSAIFVRWAGVPGTVSAFYRVLIAGAVLIPWALKNGDSPDFRRRKNGDGADIAKSLGNPAGGNQDSPGFGNGDSPDFGRRGNRDSPRFAVAVAGGVFFALDLALWNTAVMKTQAAVASILGNNTPIFVGLMTWIVFRRRPRAAFWIGLGLALAGCLLIMNASVREASRGTLSGNALALIASVFFAAYLVVTERVRKSMDTLTFNALAIAGSIATLLVICLVMGLPLWGFSTRTWMALAGLGLISQLMAYYGLVYALGHLPATITSVGLLAQIPCTAALAWLLLGEPLGPSQLAGGAIVLAGIWVVNRE